MTDGAREVFRHGARSHRYEDVEFRTVRGTQRFETRKMRAAVAAACVAGALVGAVGATATSTPAEAEDDRGAGTAGIAGLSNAAGAAQPEGPAEYVVTFAGDAGDAQQAIAEAGGQVVDVNEQFDMALVEATGDGFLEDIGSSDALTGVARNHSVGTARPGQPHRFAAERPTLIDRLSALGEGDVAGLPPELGGSDGTDANPLVPAEPLADRQWDMGMIGATPAAAHRTATGGGVRVGIIDTGIDGSHPDLAPNFDAEASRNFTTDMPDIDGPCEVESCVDPANVDDGGHGTHVAGTVAAAANGVGIAGVAPEATLVNVRAGQDSGYFFLYETVNALTYAADIGLDVVNMSFYVDPWLYNCASRDGYVAGSVTDDELAQQALTLRLVTEALDYAHESGVTLVAAAGNGHTDLAADHRLDETSPDHPAGAARARTVTRDCLDLPSEGENVISVSAVGPSGGKADYSNYGQGAVELAAPGGYVRDHFGTPQYQQPANMVLSSYPLDVARDEGLVDENGEPIDGFSVRSCSGSSCGFYTYLQGTSMASPHVAGVAALAVQAHGEEDGEGGYSLPPDAVAAVLADSARDQACPVGGTVDYADEGRTPEWNATCTGTPIYNGFYGEGIVDAAAAVGR
jgi:subtilisin family serine protease